MALFELGLTTIGKNFFKIHHQHLPSKDIKEIVLFYYKVSILINPDKKNLIYYVKWKKTKRADSYGAKTRNSKRKFENCTNYMDKLLDDIETKRSRRGEKTKRLVLSFSSFFKSSFWKQCKCREWSREQRPEHRASRADTVAARASGDDAWLVVEWEVAAK